jgi:hypothetical protein
VGDIVDMAEFRRKKLAKRGEQQQFHPAGTGKGYKKKGEFGKAEREIDGLLSQMGLNPDDYKD